MGACLSSCYVFKAYKYRNFELKDVEKLGAVPLQASTQPFVFAYDTLNHTSLQQYLDSNLTRSHTYAFLVIRNDTILYERYFGAITESTKLPSFSVAKSVVSTLVGIALQEGLIQSLHDPITRYLPYLRERDNDFDLVTIQHVLDMRSGVRSSENYFNPFSNVLQMGFASNVSKPASKVKLGQMPGQFEYKSVNTQLLAMILEKVTGKKLQDYVVEKLWAPLGMEHAATWNSDKEQTVRAFCCINAAARDYAKFGRLFLKKGAWQGRQVVPEDWVFRSVNADTMSRYGGYRNQWWSDSRKEYFKDSLAAVAFANQHTSAEMKTYRMKNSNQTGYRVDYHTGEFHAEGILGQYVYVNPAKNLVIVRLGHNWSHPKMYAQRFIYNLGQALR
ncbi:MAG TPA: serine hydrolase [Flavipsychrobacter sp.]|nr:serine hydrolase [Flavipsychrobacter sp.]